MTQRSDIRLQLLPHECAVLQKWNATPDVQDQLEALAPDVDVATIKLTRVDLDWLIGDLNQAIVELDCDDEDAHELCERLEFILETGKGSLRAWY
jgi:Fe-S-cluster formation regulator IscX/YfhJ